MRNLAIYTTARKPPSEDALRALPGVTEVTSNKRWYLAASSFHVSFQGGAMSLNLLPSRDRPAHLRKATDYVKVIDAQSPIEDLDEVLSFMGHVSVVIGVASAEDFAFGDATWDVIVGVAKACHGWIYVADSFINPHGRVLFGQAGELLAAGASEAPHNRSAHLQAQRKVVLEALSRKGFVVSPALPVLREIELRPPLELARRLLAVEMLMGWVCAPEDRAPSNGLRAVIGRHDLGEVLGARGKAMLDTPRGEATQQWVDQIGWLMEGAWPIAWMFGLDPMPTPFAGVMDAEQIQAVLGGEFLPYDVDLEAWVAAHPLRKPHEIIALEDMFYCVHNAARSAQLGGDTVPEGFDPIVQGGVVQERRHALTWALSAGVAWDDTDLST